MEMHRSLRGQLADGNVIGLWLCRGGGKQAFACVVGLS